MSELTTAQICVLTHQFKSRVCPVCAKSKAPRWCFCRTCYFALKRGNPPLASGLWHEAFDGTDRFFESYARAKEWLAGTGLEKLKHDPQGGLFA